MSVVQSVHTGICKAEGIPAQGFSIDSSATFAVYACCAARTTKGRWQRANLAAASVARMTVIRRRRSSIVIDFGKSTKLDETAFLAAKFTVFLSLPSSKVPSSPLAEVLVVIADMEFVVLDGAVDRSSWRGR